MAKSAFQPAFQPGDFVEIAPHFDRWMRGDRYGVVVKHSQRFGVYVKMDKSGKVLRFPPDGLTRLNPRKRRARRPVKRGRSLADFPITVIGDPGHAAAQRRTIARLTRRRGRRNPPLTAVRAIAPNMTEASHGAVAILYSYQTPVALYDPYIPRAWVTTKRWSNTTSRHIAKWLASKGGPPSYKISQEAIEEAAMGGKQPVTANPRHGRVRRRVVMRRARRRGFGWKRGRRNPRGFLHAPGRALSESSMWRQVKTIATSLARSQQRNEGAVDPSVQELRIIASAALDQLRRGVHENPALALIGAANPPRGQGRLIGCPIEIKYERKHGAHPGFYRHPFKKSSRARLLAMPDGSLRIVS